MIAVKGRDKNGSKVLFSIEQYLADNLDRIIKRNSKGWDHVAIITGLPGVGKSTFARYLARYLDETFNEDRVYFDAAPMIEGMNNSENKKSFVLDESFKDFSSKASMKQEYADLINHLQLLRQKQHYIFLILPDFFSLSKHLALFRSSFLYVVYEDSQGDRCFAVFDREKKKELYILGKQFMNYNAVQPNFRGNFPIKCRSGEIVDEELYEKRKREHLLSQGKQEKRGGIAKDMRDKLIVYMFSEMKIPAAKIREIADCSLRAVYSILEKNGITQRYERRLENADNNAI